MTSVVAASASPAATALVVAEGLRARYTAAAPATCGEAMDVPEYVADADADVMPAESTSTPGAKRSTSEP